MVQRIPKSEKRSFSEIEDHYRVEKKLARKLMNSEKEERKALYAEVYDELFRRVPKHPQLIEKRDYRQRREMAMQKLCLIRRYLRPDSVFLEIGPGDCALSLEVAKEVKKVFGIDVSQEIARAIKYPSNFELIISDGSSVEVQEGSVDVAYSNQLMEHLHPEDAKAQLKNIFTALSQRGVYICITPNKISGPHDISKYFDENPTGFHLKEYSISELRKAFLEAGFSRIKTYIGGRGIYLRFPLGILLCIEGTLFYFPEKLRKKITRTFFFRALLGIIIVGVK